MAVTIKTTIKINNAEDKNLWSKGIDDVIISIRLVIIVDKLELHGFKITLGQQIGEDDLGNGPEVRESCVPFMWSLENKDLRVAGELGECLSACLDESETVENAS